MSAAGAGDRARARWDARHAVVTGTVAAPPDGLRGREDLLPPGGRALDVACGRGAVAAWLAERGFAVDAVDVSPVGLAAGAALAPAVHWIDHDLTGGLPVTGPYDVVVCQRYRDPALYPALVGALAPGGLLVITVLSEVGDTGGPFRAAPGELAAAFAALDVLAYTERGGEATLLARSAHAPDVRGDRAGSRAETSLARTRGRAERSPAREPVRPAAPPASRGSPPPPRGRS